MQASHSGEAVPIVQDGTPLAWQASNAASHDPQALAHPSGSTWRQHFKAAVRSPSDGDAQTSVRWPQSDHEQAARQAPSAEAGAGQDIARTVDAIRIFLSMRQHSAASRASHAAEVTWST